MNHIKQAVIIFCLTIFALTILPLPFNGEIALAQDKGVFALPDSSLYGDNIAKPSGATAQAQFASLTEGLLLNLRYILGAIAILMMVYAGFNMVIAWGNEEKITKNRQLLFYAIIGLAIVGMAGEFSKIFTVEGGGFLKDPNAIIRASTLFNQRTQIVITFIKYFIGSIAILEIVTTGIRLITMGGAEDKIARDKQNLLYGIIGLVLIIVADTAINKILYKVDSAYPTTGGVQPTVDAARGVQEIVGVTNLMVTVVGVGAVLALVAAGVMYMTSGGNEDQMNKAKAIIKWVVIGMIVIFGAFAIVSTFVGGQFQ